MVYPFICTFNTKRDWQGSRLSRILSAVNLLKKVINDILKVILLVLTMEMLD